MNQETIIVFDKVQKIYGDKYALKNFNFEVRKGAFLTVVGGSGGGKTTMLKMINGLLMPDGGRVMVNGKDTAHTDLIALRRGIGYVIQGGALFPHLNVRENIEYVPRLEKNRLTEERIQELMDMAALPMDMLSRNVSELSGGQQQRVGIARALAAKPEIILMDEPFGALDGITRKQLQDEILGIHRRTGVTIVFVTHDLREAVRLGTWILIMNEGKIVQQGTPQDVRDNPNGDYAQRLLEQLDCG
ncbi:ATP-binding cassette domain-containing protein [Christensenella tenuis]|jgi:osmoprotectant transport system ATP-binding protein|uniref:ABC transporter ATP-binding protein n=1 Tax=Christensenella tenuis TaxID=2763033 RepID=A0ABR7EE23_9FIRM|nr:ABC transporter ATP-binding protein [Christensenella tenuis]MBC5647903.1 ABC transporter ATP-binding protein [Christensenella tenuis]